MIPLQTRIFVPWADPYTMQGWVETVAGKILQPFVNVSEISWFWFTRYMEDDSGSNGDSDLTDIPNGFRHPHQDIYRSVRLRIWLEKQERGQVEQSLNKTVSDAGCWIADLRDYDDLNDLANHRFCGEPFEESRREVRRDLMREFLCSSSKLFFHMLQGPDSKGSYYLERNIDRLQNPEENTFQSIHHLFCNLTDVPLQAQIKVPFSVGSNIYPPNDGGTIQPVKIRF